MSASKPSRNVRDLSTYGLSRAVRHLDFDYASDIFIALTICAQRGAPFSAAPLAGLVCESIEKCSQLCKYDLLAYCLMPDHLHVLLSPGMSGLPIREWLRRMKSYTTNKATELGWAAPLWQRSAHDHVCRDAADLRAVAAYIANNPVRAGLVQCWTDWPWTKPFV